MARADALIKTVNRVLKRFDGMSRSVYKRTVTVTGNELIDRATRTFTDTLVDNPKPVFNQLGKRMALVLSGSAGKQFAVDDYSFTFSPDTLTRDELEQGNLQLVLKDPSGNADVLKILWFDPASLNGKDIAWTVIARSVSR